MRHFDAVFDKLAADAKATRNLIGGASIKNQLAQDRVWNERGGANCIGSLFIGLVVITREYFRFCSITLERVRSILFFSPPS